MMRFEVRRLYRDETRYLIAQNLVPREWPDLWYFSIYAWPFYFSVSRSRRA